MIVCPFWTLGYRENCHLVPPRSQLQGPVKRLVILTIMADLCSVLRRDAAPSGLNMYVSRAAPRHASAAGAVPGNVEPDQSAGSTTDKPARVTGAGGGRRNREISPAEPCRRDRQFDLTPIPEFKT